MKLAGRVAVVTGGSRGLGLAMAEAFAAAGSDVVVASRKLEACADVATRLEKEHGVRAVPIACNVSDWEQCDRLFDDVMGHFGRVDVLVNNAGLSPLYDGLGGISEAYWDKVLGVNLKGPFRLAVLFGEHMRSHGSGSIINISSVDARKPEPHAIPYSAAKAGLNSITRSLARALGPQVRVNCIQCGAFLTDISHAWEPSVFDMVKEGTSLRRPGRPEEIVGAALYLASDDSSYTTGSILELDGGVL